MVTWPWRSGREVWPTWFAQLWKLRYWRLFQSLTLSNEDRQVRRVCPYSFTTLTEDSVQREDSGRAQWVQWVGETELRVQEDQGGYSLQNRLPKIRAAEKTPSPPWEFDALVYAPRVKSEERTIWKGWKGFDWAHRRGWEQCLWLLTTLGNISL